MKPQIFISYKSEEFHYADKVRFELEQNGISCWMAPESIPGGASYATEIPRAIRECKGFVLILTDKSQKSQWVTRELDRAINDGKTVFPFVPEKMTFNDDIKFYLTNVQMYPAYEDWDRELARMLSDVADIVGVKLNKKPTMPPSTPPLDPPGKRRKETKPETTDKPKQGRGKIVLLSVLAGVLVLAAVIGLISFIAYQSNSVMILNERYDKSAGELVLSDARLTEQDVKAIAGFEKLRTLSLTNCELATTDLSPLSLKSLYHLTLSGCGLTVNSFRTIDLGETKIYALDISNNPNLNSLDGIAGLTELETLKADGNGLTTLQPVSGMTKLKNLSVSDNALNTLEGLEPCIYLESVNVNNNQLNSLDSLKNTTILKSLWASGNTISDVSPLTNSAGTIQVLCLENNLLTNTGVIAKMTGLTHLDLSKNQLTEIDSLSALQSLVALDAAENQLTEIDTDKLSPTLTYLDLSFNKLSRLEGNGFQLNHPYEGYLDLEGNLLHTVPFQSENEYDLLNLADNPLDNTKALQSVKVDDTLIVGYTSDFNEEKMSSVIKKRLYLLDCPLERRVSISGYLGEKVKYLTTEEFRGQRDECLPADYYTISKNREKLKGISS